MDMNVKTTIRIALGLLLFFALFAPITLKWALDSRVLPLSRDHKRLYYVIHRHTFPRVCRFPNLVSPTSFNDKMQWLKLFDQSHATIICHDKLLVRDFIESKLGPSHLPKLLWVGEDVKDFQKLDPKLPVVFKTNHDSGSVRVIRNKSDLARNDIVALFTNSLNRTYGADKGEWAYTLIHPTLFAEEFIIPENQSKVPADWKFHCASGTVAFVQYIAGRGENPVEAVLDREGKPIDEKFSHRFGSSAEIAIPPNWAETIEKVERLAADWKYVRVDCYLENSRCYVGELTFYPLSGCYRGEGQRVLGELLSFDTSTFKAPIISQRVNSLINKTGGLKGWVQFT